MILVRPGSSIGQAGKEPGPMSWPDAYSILRLSGGEVKLALLTHPKALPLPRPKDPRSPKSRADVAFGEVKNRGWAEHTAQVSSFLKLLSVIQ